MYFAILPLAAAALSVLGILLIAVGLIAVEITERHTDRWREPDGPEGG